MIRDLKFGTQRSCVLPSLVHKEGRRGEKGQGGGGLSQYVEQKD